MAKVACSVLMKVLCGARVARWDLLKAVTRLASQVSKWTERCDKDLHSLMSYIACSSEFVLHGYIGDEPGELSLKQYDDADFAGDRPSYKSTSGMILALEGRRS